MTINNCSELLTRIQSQVNSIRGQDVTWTQISNGVYHAIALKTDGTLWTWGCNGQGRLGDGTEVNRCCPGTVAAGGIRWCQISGGRQHTASIKCDGTLWTWGFNSFGQLGDGTVVSRSSPGTVAGGGTNWCQVSGGRQHTVAIKTDGTLWTWGYNGTGQLGDGTIVSRSSPGTVAGAGTTWCQVSGGYAHTTAIKTDGTLWTWGCNGQGRLGDGTTVNKSSPGTVAGGGTNWCQVSSGSRYQTAAIKSDGTLWTWGYNGQGVLGDGTAVSRSSPGTTAGCGTTWCQVESGSVNMSAIKTDGTLWTWGRNSCGGLGNGTITSRQSPGTVVGGGTTWCYVSGGIYHTMSVKTDGTLWTWGDNTAGKLGDGTVTNRCSPGSIPIQLASSAKELTLLSAAVSQATNNRQVAVASSNELPDIKNNSISNGQMIFLEDRLIPVIANNECWLGLDGRVLRSDAPTRTLFSWGYNLQGQLGDGTVVSRSSPGTVAGGGTNWCLVSGGDRNAAAAIKTDGTLWTWGRGNCGTLGDGNATSRCSPGTVAGGGTTWCQVSTVYRHSLAIKTDGTLWTWGFNFAGRLGDGTTVQRLSPGTVAGGGTNWCQVSGGSSHTAAIKTDGTLWTWGYNGQGRLGNGTTVDRCSPGTIAGGGTNWCQVAGGGSQTAAIKTDGTLWTWGFNCCGRLGNATTVDRCSPGTVAGAGTNWCQVSVGNYHTAAIKTEGTLWTWGFNCCGRLGDGTTLNRSSPGTVAGGGTNWCQVSGATAHTAAIKTDGTLWTWGCNTTGQLGDGTVTSRCSPGTVAGGGTNWCQVSGGCYHIVALQVQ